MIGIDSNFLVACELREHEHYEGVHAILDELVERNERFAIAPQVISEFIHVITDGRRMKKPHSMRLALERAALWCGSVDVTTLVPEQRAVDLFFDWMDRFSLGRKRVLDTMFAATLFTAGVKRLATINRSDFEIFGTFQLISPKC